MLRPANPRKKLLVWPRPGLKAVCAGLLLCFSGCSVWQPVRHIEKPALVPSYQSYYDYPKNELTAKIVHEEQTRSYILRTVEFPLSLPPELEVPDKAEFIRKNEELFKTDQKTSKDQALRYTIRIDYYLPKKIKPGEKKPAILISPILGGNMVVDHFARYYAGRGFAAAIVYRKRLFWDEARGQDMNQFEDYMRISVMRLRQAVDWLLIQPEVDPDRIGAFGVSYGAILHAVLAAVEPRIRYHVLAMPAGSLGDVIAECPDAAVTKLIRYAREHYGWSVEKVRADLKAVIKTDPLLVASRVPREKVQIYAALFDRVVGADRTFQLWKAMGKPKLRILPFGHYGGVVVFPYLQIQSGLAFKWHLRKRKQ